MSGWQAYDFNVDGCGLTVRIHFSYRVGSTAEVPDMALLCPVGAGVAALRGQWPGADDARYWAGAVLEGEWRTPEQGRHAAQLEARRLVARRLGRTVVSEPVRSHGAMEASLAGSVINR